MKPVVRNTNRLAVGWIAVALIVLIFGSDSAAQSPGFVNVPKLYSKHEYQIPMRDGVRLHTTIYHPRDRSKKYPILLNRSPYSCMPYGKERYRSAIGPSVYMEKEGYVFVHQDVRGRWNSGGQFDNMRPNIEGEQGIDESSDTYDTIEWLLESVVDNNGKVGMWGISYPGFYCSAALPDHHPALVASSPQAPICDFFFDDFHHHGAYLLSYLRATGTFGYQHKGPTTKQWYPDPPGDRSDPWSFFMNLGPMSNAAKIFPPGNEFWDQTVEHPNYDDFWQRRNIAPHLKNISTNVLTVGGWYDAEDLYGTLTTYKAIESQNPDIFNAIVMGPWSHGDWASRSQEYYRVGKVGIGRGLADQYQRDVEAPFFAHFLKGIGPRPDFEALTYDTGKSLWNTASVWPPESSNPTRYHFATGRALTTDPPTADAAGADYDEFISDPANPVPYRQRADLAMQFTPRQFMTDDQRFASARDDVLVYQTPPLDRPVTVAGDLLTHLSVSTTGTSADWAVKLIDVYPDNHPFVDGSDAGLQFGGFQRLIRSEVIRGRFRDSYEFPQPFVSDEVATIDLPLQDILHTFKPGHRIMIQVQSTMFPYIDRNPQKYVDNIFKATADDFISATHRIYHSAEHPSWIEMPVLSSTDGS